MQQIAPKPLIVVDGRQRGEGAGASVCNVILTLDAHHTIVRYLPWQKHEAS